MGLDGFSMANLGLYNRMTSAQMSNEVDVLAARGNENQVKDIEFAFRKKGIERKQMDYSETGGQAFLGGDAEQNDEDELLPEPEVIINDDEEDLEHSPNRYEMKINSQANIVELYDNYLNVTVQRLTVQDMLSMFKKFNDPSGVIVNKKI